MTRMVEENRTHIGTLKTLGYSGLQISAKFIIYASLASIIGGILGMLIGFSLLPKIIWMMYSMMYFIPNFVIEFNWLYASIGLISIYICIIGATILSIRKEIKQLPAVLMRPKAPTAGKRVLLEKIGFIWNRLNFIQKVTVRNMFRYKKRLLLTVIGIFGCTSLIVTGFGIKDSIARILSDQYGNIFRYDLQVHLKKDLNESQINDVLKNILDK
ncbi:MAG: FtsX-like permease family protein, partial [Candidatus Scatovivens sp.]